MGSKNSGLEIPEILGVCGGNGFMLYPLRSKLIANIEPRTIFYTRQDYQWKANFKVPMAQGLGISSKRRLIIVGHPDCGDSSMLRFSRSKKLENPAENKSVSTFVSFVNNLKPEVFLMENLIGFKRLGDLGEIFKGYILVLHECSVFEFGNSQLTRKRLIVVGLRVDVFASSDAKYFKVFKVGDPKLSKNITELNDSLEPLDKPTNVFNIRELDDWRIPMYWGASRNLSVAETRKIWNTKLLDKSRWEINFERMRCQPGIYKLQADKYPPTVRKEARQFNMDGNILTPRQLAAIQGATEDFKLPYSPHLDLKYQLNKARVTVGKTPPMEITRWFKKCLIKLYKNT